MATIADLHITIADHRVTIANLNETLDEFRRKFASTSSKKVFTIADEAQDDAEPAVVKEHTWTRKDKAVQNVFISAFVSGGRM